MKIVLSFVFFLVITSLFAQTDTSYALPKFSPIKYNRKIISIYGGYEPINKLLVGEVSYTLKMKPSIPTCYYRYTKWTYPFFLQINSGYEHSTNYEAQLKLGFETSLLPFIIPKGRQMNPSYNNNFISGLFVGYDVLYSNSGFDGRVKVGFTNISSPRLRRKKVMPIYKIYYGRDLNLNNQAEFKNLNGIYLLIGLKF